MAMKRIAALLLTSVLLLSCVGCAQDGRKEPGAEKADLGLTAEVKPATDFTAKANAAVYDELDFDDKQEYEFATRVLIDAPETLELKDENGTILWSQEAYAFLDDYEKAPDSVNPSLCRTRRTTMPMVFLKWRMASIRSAAMTWQISLLSRVIPAGSSLTR